MKVLNGLIFNISNQFTSIMGKIGFNNPKTAPVNGLDYAIFKQSGLRCSYDDLKIHIYPYVLRADPRRFLRLSSGGGGTSGDGYHNFGTFYLNQSKKGYNRKNYPRDCLGKTLYLGRTDNYDETPFVKIHTPKYFPDSVTFIEPTMKNENTKGYIEVKLNKPEDSSQIDNDRGCFSVEVKSYNTKFVVQTVEYLEFAYYKNTK